LTLTFGSPANPIVVVMKKYLLLPLGAICLNWSAAAISADFVAVRVEAEDFTSKSDRWALTSDTQTPDLGPDPDPPHNNTASGKANLELLPDTRVTHDDEVHNGGNEFKSARSTTGSGQAAREPMTTIAASVKPSFSTYQKQV